MANQAIDIPVTVAGANTPTVDLSTYAAENRTFLYTGPAGSTVAIFASADGVHYGVGPLLTVAANTQPVPKADRSFRYRAVPTIAGGQLTVDVGPANDGGAVDHFNTLPLGNFPTGGVVTTSTIVDEYGAFTINQTTAGQTLTFPAPLDMSATWVKWVSNIGTQSFVLYGITILPASGTELVWNGSAWFAAGPGTASPTETVIGAGGQDILDSDGTITELGNSNAIVAGSQMTILAGSAGLFLQVDSTGKIAASTVSGHITFSPGGGFGIGQLTPKAKLDVNGAVIFEPLGTPVADGTGSLGTAAATVDGTSVLEVNQTTPVITYGNMRLIQPPTNATAHGRKLTICNVGTAAFIVGDAVQKQGVNLIPGTTPGAAASANKGQACTFTWNGTAWVPDDTGPGVPVAGGNLADGSATVVRQGRCTVYHLPTVANNDVLTFGATGALIGDQVGIIRDDGANANTVTIRNIATTTLAVMKASAKATFWGQYNGSDWEMIGGGAF